METEALVMPATWTKGKVELFLGTLARKVTV